MKLHLANLKEGVITRVHQDYDPKLLDLEFVDLKYTGPLSLEGAVEKGPDTLTFRGHLVSQIERICARCLISVKDRVDQPFELFYEIKGREEIETLDDIRELLILDHPIQFVCQEDCCGLCPTCGTNLNESRCHCDTSQASPFVPLKKIWAKSKKEKRHG